MSILHAYQSAFERLDHEKTAEAYIDAYGTSEGYLPYEYYSAFVEHEKEAEAQHLVDTFAPETQYIPAAYVGALQKEARQPLTEEEMQRAKNIGSASLAANYLLPVPLLAEAGASLGAPEGRRLDAAVGSFGGRVAGAAGGALAGGLGGYALGGPRAFAPAAFVGGLGGTFYGQRKGIEHMLNKEAFAGIANLGKTLSQYGGKNLGKMIGQGTVTAGAKGSGVGGMQLAKGSGLADTAKFYGNKALAQTGKFMKNNPGATAVGLGATGTAGVGGLALGRS